MTKWLDVNEIRSRLKIEEVIGRDFELRPIGRNDLRSHEHPSLSVNPEKQVYCWHSHDENDAGTVVDWVMNRLKCSFREALEHCDEMLGNRAPLGAKHEIHLPPVTKNEVVVRPPSQEEVSYYVDCLRESSSALEWIAGRHISTMTMNVYQLGYIEDYYGRGPATTIPVYDMGELKTIRLRMWDKNASPRYRPIRSGLGAWMMNDQFIAQKGEELVIVEGEIKSIILAQFGIHAVGLMGNSLKREWMSRFPRNKRVYIWLDPDINTMGKTWVKEFSFMHGDTHVIRSVAKPDDAMIAMRDCANEYWQGMKKSSVKIKPAQKSAEHEIWDY
jgi:DNA primase